MTASTKKMKKNAYARRESLSYMMLMGPSFTIMLALTFVPVLISMWQSLWQMNYAMPDKNKFVWFDNYARMFFRDLNFWEIMGNTFVQVFFTVFFQVVIGIILALLFSREVRGMGTARSLLMIPMMVTPVVVGVIWRYMLNPTFGIVNYLLSLFGIGVIDWLGTPTMAMFSIIMSDIWLSTPFVTVIIIAGISSLPKDTFEAAAVDGANAVKTFWHVTLPQLAPVIWVSVMFRLIDAFKRFDSIMIMTAGGPGYSTETLNLYAYMTGFTYFDVGYSSALATFLFLIICAISAFTITKVQNSGNL